MDMQEPALAPVRYRYMEVADDLAGKIASGDLPVGSVLPSEGALAHEYGVSLGTARHATKVLRERGVVVTLKSKGSYVARQVPTRDS